MVAVNTMSIEAETIKSPIAIIRERIAAKRLYEARFLLRQLGDELTPANREQMAKQLEDTIHALEQKHRDALYYAGQGNFDRAAELLEGIEQVTVDFPDLDREKERLNPVDPILEILNRDKKGYPSPGGGASRTVSPPAQPQRPVVKSSPGQSPRKPPQMITAFILALPVVLAIIVASLLLRR